MEIKSLATTPFDTVFEAFSSAFADYEVQLDKEQHRIMLERRGFDPALSFASFDNDRIVAFTTNGIGDFNSVRTAYDAGTGTLKDYRGQGLATRIFKEALPHLKESGVRQYLLEVLQHNTGAVSVYRKIGFEVTREFNYFRQKNTEVKNELKAKDDYRVKEIDLATDDYQVKEIDLALYDVIPSFWDFYPSWQNSFESIKRSPEQFAKLGAFHDGALVGYCVFEPVAGDVTQIAVDKAHRRKGIGSLLLQNMLDLNRNDSIKIINTDIRCTSITGFLESKNIGVTGKQYEMIKKIDFVSSNP